MSQLASNRGHSIGGLVVYAPVNMNNGSRARSPTRLDFKQETGNRQD
jgi:hypothetical protein